MAKFSNHSRSISLPSSSHPLLVTAEEHLQRLKASSEAASSHASACQKLDGLKELYECLDDVLQLPLSQQVLSHERSGKCEEEVLDGSLRLLDICGTVKDIYSQMKGSIQELQSSLRRKGTGDMVTPKKHLNKLISKCYKELKKAEKNNKDSEIQIVPLVSLVKQVQEVSLPVMQSLLFFLSGSKSRSQPKGWSLVSKLLQQKRASSEGDSDIAAIEQIENQLHLLNSKNSNKDVIKKLQEVDSNIQELEEVLEIFFRLLLKTRVSLLNILNH